VDLRETGRERVDRMHLAEGRDHWRAVVNAVMRVRVKVKR